MMPPFKRILLSFAFVSDKHTIPHLILLLPLISGQEISKWIRAFLQMNQKDIGKNAHAILDRRCPYSKMHLTFRFPLLAPLIISSLLSKARVSQD